MLDSNNENKLHSEIIKAPTAEKKFNIIKKDHILRIPRPNQVDDRSNLEQTEKVVLQGTEEDIIQPGQRPYILRSGARSGCDASLLLEVADDGTTHVALTHWEPTDQEREWHSKTVSRLNEQPVKGKRFAVIVSSTLSSLEEASKTALYQKMAEWNGGRNPDLVYIPFEGIQPETIGTSQLYQLVLAARKDGGEPQFKISVPGTKYTKNFTSHTLPDNTTPHESTFIKP